MQRNLHLSFKNVTITSMCWLLSITGRKNQLRGVCSNDEGRHRLEKGFKAVLAGEVQQPQLKADEGWIFADKERER